MNVLGLRAAVWSLALWSCWLTSPALAQQPTSNKIAAEALFDRGLAAMQEGKLAEACAQLEQSQRLEAGIGTMLYLAECYERMGRIASAWALFREAASAAGAEGQTDRAQAGTARARALEPRLPKLTLRVDQSRDTAGLEVLRDGAPVPSSLFGLDVPVDPGEHTIEARAPSMRPWKTTIAIQVATARVVDVPALEPEPAAPSAGPTAPAAVALPNTRRGGADQPEPESGDSVQPLIGIVVGAAGVVALGVGTYFGLRAISKHDDADARCMAAGTPGRECADARGVALNGEAQDAATLANVLVIGGAALAITGVVLYFTAPSSERAAVAIAGDASGARLLLEGSF